MSSDLTFITNEEDQNLETRFNTLIKDTRFFDCLVGYFYTSGFYAIYKSLESTEKIRVLIGISTGKETLDLIDESKKENQLYNEPSNQEVKTEFTKHIVTEMDESKDTIEVEEGIQKFIEWLKIGKLEIKVYPVEKIHAKLYIMTFKEGDRDIGRVITGSSNFTKSGLKENIEFNVELKNRSDYEFSLKKFNELWDRSVDVSEKYIEIIKKETWLNDEITPYELYLKFLYEYLKEKINLDKDELFREYLPEEFMDLKYQRDAVIDAKMKLEEYGGVFISDVVGLGKTYISAILAQQLDGRNLVIAPPALLDKNNPGSWPNVFTDFGVRQTNFESIGKLDTILKQGVEKYSNIFIDEAHRFRTETTLMYEDLFEICRGKRVILVSATPLNNTPLDILNQIKLFQNAHKSTLPNPKVRDLEKYFTRLQNRLKGLDRFKDNEEYLRIVKENSEDIRENVLQYLMVRRTRTSIMKYYKEDLINQKLKFPKIEDPEPIVYHFDEKLDEIFMNTLKLIINEFKYSRYTPLLYMKKGISQPEEISQKNMGRFMKILLLKRLESSFHAFKQSIDRFINSYKLFIETYHNGQVFISKKHINKIFELLEIDDSEAIQKLLDKGKAHKFESKDFISNFINDLEHDYKLLRKIQTMWKEITKDPKLDRFIELLEKDSNLKQNKLLVFTESKETANYLGEKLNPILKNKAIVFSSASSSSDRNKIIENFDANVRTPLQKNDYRVLISTDILAEGVSLHRSNVVINYDIPWNPVRMMQRVGRVNRVTKNLLLDTIFTYNFFPAGPINKEISLKEAAEAKIKSFIEMLGNDAKLLTDEDVKSHDLFMKLTSKQIIIGENDEEDLELKHLIFLRNVRDNQQEFFNHIKKLPKKARTAREYNEKYNSVITFFRKGKLRKIFLTNKATTFEVDFIGAVKMLEVPLDTKKGKLGNDFYEYLKINKGKFDELFSNEDDVLRSSGGRSYEAKLKKIIKAIRNASEITDDDEDYLLIILETIDIGGIPKVTLKRILKYIEDETSATKIINILKRGISSNLLIHNIQSSAIKTVATREIILSEYLMGKNHE